MKNSDRKWNTYFSQSILPMLFIDYDFHILALNEAMIKKTGYEIGDLLQMNFTELLVDDVNDQLRQLIYEDQYYSFLMKLQIRNKDKELLNVTACINNFFTIEGWYEESLVVLNPTGYDYHLNFDSNNPVNPFSKN